MVLRGLSFPLANYLVLFLTPDWALGPPQSACTFLTKMDSREQGSGMVIRAYYGLVPPPFLTPRSLSGHVELGTSPWPQEWLMWSSYLFLRQQSSAPAINLLLEVSKRSKAQFSQPNKPLLFSARGPIYLLPHLQIYYLLLSFGPEESRMNWSRAQALSSSSNTGNQKKGK